MFSTIFGLLFSKLGAMFAGGLAALLFFFKLKRTKNKLKEAENRVDVLEVENKNKEVDEEYHDDIHDLEQAEENNDAQAVVDFINNKWGEKENEAD
ncbi:MAG: hypothetical protein ACOC5T_03960 [Elusimicrobiota bacterium]